MKSNLFFNLIIILAIFNLLIGKNSKSLFHNKNDILIYNPYNKDSSFIENIFNKHDIQFQKVDILEKNNNNLYIILNIEDISIIDLPQYYIVYQSLNLENDKITNEYINKLAYSIAVWDISWDNINKYMCFVKNYCFFPENYDFADPIILSCLLPLNTLGHYKEILIYSNNNNSDISSHLPTLFCYSILQNSEIVIEVGMKAGEASKAFIKTLDLLNKSKIIGIDSNPNAGQNYWNIANAYFFYMDNEYFPYYWKSLKKGDIIFFGNPNNYYSTMKELTTFVPLLENNGCLIFSYTYMSQLSGFTYNRLNNTIGSNGWNNNRDITKAIKDFFHITFDEAKYAQFDFINNHALWKLVHYPFCDGLTLIKRIQDLESNA